MTGQARVAQRMAGDQQGVFDQVGLGPDDDGQDGGREEFAALAGTGEGEEDRRKEDEARDLDVQAHASGDSCRPGRLPVQEIDREQDEEDHHRVGIAVKARDHDRGRCQGQQHQRRGPHLEAFPLRDPIDQDKAPQVSRNCGDT